MENQKPETNLENKFYERYPQAKEIMTVFCPYRICPLGAHIDHQYGAVTGFAIDHGIHIAFCPTEDGSIEAASLNFEGTKKFSIREQTGKQNDWADYLRGAAAGLSKNYELHSGLKCVIQGTLPIGGLSSSAAVTIAFLSALAKANGIALTARETIDTALWSENNFVGVSVGKLDQSCEVYCKKEHLLYLDTKDDSFELIPQTADMKPYEIAVFFSGIERSLVGSKFNMRVDELKSASYALKAFAGLEYGKFADSRLRDVPKEIFEKYKDKLPENWRKRAAHYYTEMERVQLGREAWRAGNIEQFGKYCFESGYSSIHNYESGSDELKIMYQIMLETDGIYGGRFSGAGFNGCCMAMIDPAYKDKIAENMQNKYLRAFPRLEDKYAVHFCSTSNGVTL